MRLQPGMCESTIGSIYALIQEQAERADFSLSYLSGAFIDPEAWKQTARAKLLELLAYNPEPCPLDVEVVERSDMGDHLREKIYFRSGPTGKVPGYVLIPQGVQFPAPGVIVLHCHGGMYRWGKEKVVDVGWSHRVLAEYRASFYSGRCVANELVRRGYVVIVIDAFYFGERRLLLNSGRKVTKETEDDILAQNDLSRKSEDVVAKTFLMAGITWPGVLVWDDIRTVDYLISRPEVDASRLGCIGLSLGGWRSVYLAGLDPRIKCAVVVGWMSSLGKMLANHAVKHTWMIFVPGQYKYLDLPDVASMLAPNPLLVIHAKGDELFPYEGAEAAFQKLNEVYARLGCEKNFHASIYDGPHEFNAEMQEEAFAWLDSALKQGGVRYVTGE